jgi:hypothetical protein
MSVLRMSVRDVCYKDVCAGCLSRMAVQDAYGRSLLWMSVEDVCGGCLWELSVLVMSVGDVCMRCL